MSASPRRDLEILIHTAAPSSGHDDARYRALAHAYLHFEPARRQEIYRRPSDDELEDEQAGSQLQEELILSTQERPGSESYQPQEESHSTQYSTQYVVEEESPTEDGSDGNADQDIARRIMDSPQLSFGSVLDNVDSPVFRGLEYTTMVIASDGVQPNNPPADDGNADSWQPPPSTIEDSQPNRNHHKSTALFSSPTRVLELYLRHFKTAKDTDLSQSQKRDQWSLPITISTSTDSIEIRSERSTSSITSSPTGGAQNRTAGRLQMNRSQSLRERQTQGQTQVDNPVGDLRPTTCPLPDGNEGRRSTFKRRHQEASSPTNSPPATERTTNPPKRARPGLESSENQSSSNNIPSSNPLISTPPLLSATDTTSYCLEIHPPPPTISDMDLTPSSLVTKSLQGLAERMKLKAKFQPLEQSRELRPMERGYWVVNWQIWSPALQKRSWSLLQNYVGKGGAGWGVWCTRDEDFRMFRVYCWGGIVGHVYLVLFAASETKIKGTGACWIDGQGQTVITMP